MNAFPLFNTACDLAHHFWRDVLRDGDSAIDATLGNGHDALFLANSILKKGGRLYGFDIQESAINTSFAELKKIFPDEQLRRVHFFQESHDQMGKHVKDPVRLIVYNLGYLPGGDKSVTTMTDTTLASIEQGLNMLLPDGLLSVVCYPGHDEGEREESALLDFFQKLDTRHFAISHFRFLNRKKAPSLILAQKSAK